MPSLKKMFSDVVGPLLFRELSVEGCTELGARFRRFDLVGPSLRGLELTPGDKVQVVLDGDFRTYTPFAFDPARGAMSLLVYVHGDGPGARFGQSTKRGDTVRLFGPRRSLALSHPPLPLVLVGDETSFALARVFSEARGPDVPTHLLFEVSSEDVAGTLEQLGVAPAQLFVRRPDDGHLAALDEQLRAALLRGPDSELVMTGKATTIQALRKGLKARPVAARRQEAKAYWAPGKRGLD